MPENISAGMEIPDNKLLKYALQSIRGIGRARAGLTISELNMTNKLARDLSRREVAAISEEISKYLVGRELVQATVVEGDIKRMKDIHYYKGIRHINKLPGLGQRTSTNSRTKKARTRLQLHHQTRKSRQFGIKTRFSSQLLTFEAIILWCLTSYPQIFTAHLS